MTSIPSRLGSIGAALRSIAAQGRRPDRLILSLPRKSARTGQEYNLQGSPELRCLLEEHKWIDVQRLDVDFGPGTKLLGALKWMQRNAPCNSQDILMVLDDDHCYLPHALDELARVQLARGAQCASSYFCYFFRGLMVPQGADIIAFQPGERHLESLPEFHGAFVDGDEACFLVDDLWIGLYLHAAGIQVESFRDLVVRRGLEMVYRRAESAGVDALESLRGDDRRDRVMVRAFDGLVARLSAASPEALRCCGGAVAQGRARRLREGAQRADAQIAQLELLLQQAQAAGRCAPPRAQEQLAELKHLYRLEPAS